MLNPASSPQSRACLQDLCFLYKIHWQRLCASPATSLRCDKSLKPRSGWGRRPWEHGLSLRV